MKIWRKIRPEHVFLDLSLPDKEAVLHFAAEAFARDGVVRGAGTLYEGMKTREDVMSTGIGSGIGIPHTISTDAKDAAILLIRLAKPIDFQALDGIAVDIILALVVPKDETALHLQLLAGISRLCRDPQFLKILRKAATSQVLLDGIRSLEEEMAFH